MSEETLKREDQERRDLELGRDSRPTLGDIERALARKGNARQPGLAYSRNQSPSTLDGRALDSARVDCCRVPDCLAVNLEGGEA